MGKPVAGEARSWPSPGASPQGLPGTQCLCLGLGLLKEPFPRSAPKHQPFKRPVLPLLFPQQC